MASEAASTVSSGRPRPALLAALAIAVLMLIGWWATSGKSVAPTPAASKPRVAARNNVTAPESDDLSVRLDALKRPRPASEGGSSRNPFRFYTPPPPPPPPPVAAAKPVPALPPEGPPVPTGPPPPPPIPLKYIGLIEGVPGQGKVAAFSDCRTTMHGREGEIIAGQYRLVRIGVESVVLEYVDGRGRTTIRMSGQECVGK
jgi:hypothetical protein